MKNINWSIVAGIILGLGLIYILSLLVINSEEASKAQSIKLDTCVRLANEIGLTDEKPEFIKTCFEK